MTNFRRQVDPAFAHFESLTELDLGRNRLQVLGNLPTALVTLSCAANELSGEHGQHDEDAWSFQGNDREAAQR